MLRTLGADTTVCGRHAEDESQVEEVNFNSSGAHEVPPCYKYQNWLWQARGGRERGRESEADSSGAHENYHVISAKIGCGRHAEDESQVEKVKLTPAELMKCHHVITAKIGCCRHAEDESQVEELQVARAALEERLQLADARLIELSARVAALTKQNAALARAAQQGGGPGSSGDSSSSSSSTGGFWARVA